MMKRIQKSKPLHQQNAETWAKELFHLDDFYILDTETTGVSKDDEVVQIGVINKDGAIVLNTLIRATQPMSAGAAAVNGLTDEILSTASPFTDLYVALSTTLAGKTIVAYNMDFDWRMLSQTTQRYGLPMFRVRDRHCAMKQYAKYRGVRNSTGSGYRWHKLTDACKYHKISIDNAHDALGDVRMTLALLRIMAGDV